MNDSISFIPLGGIGDVTRNMYLYETPEQTLIVDCGLGFADETMLGVDLLLPDIASLLLSKKKIVGMLLTHGHEDHIGALPFILPQLPEGFPMYASPLTAALANEKLKEFGIPRKVEPLAFGNVVRLGEFTCSLIHITHSVPDTANIVIKTPVGSFYHGSDFKFDLTPFDGKKTEFQKIAKAGAEGVLCLLSDCLGSERPGRTPSEYALSKVIEDEMRLCQGKFIFTTYSSNISRLNQAIQAATKLGRRVCFVGRSLVKAKDVGAHLQIMKLPKGMEIALDQVKNYNPKEVLLLVAGSQGQENSALSRIANGDHKDIKISPHDTIVFSSDPIPGNEVSVNSLVDTLSKSGAKVLYSDKTPGFHVSGHGSADDLMLLMSLTTPKFALPIGGTYRHMIAYRELAVRFGIPSDHVLLLEDGQEIIFSKDKVTRGKKIPIRKVYVDEISGEPIESFVLRDRQKISKEGVVVIMVEMDSETGQSVETPNVIARGFSSQEISEVTRAITRDLKIVLSERKGKVTDWMYVRKRVQEVAERQIFKTIHRRPLVLPVVIEV